MQSDNRVQIDLLETDALRAPLQRLRTANAAMMRRYPGDSGERQPVHTVYGGAHIFRADSAAKLGSNALRALEHYAPDPATLTDALGWTADAEAAHTIYERILDKLQTEPVQDFRIDFEDGYGNRSEAEEDGHARSAALEVAAGASAGTLPAWIGIRLKPLSEELHGRSVRTLEIFLKALLEGNGGLPPGFLLTLPKVTAPEQASVFAEVLELLEARFGLRERSLRFEIMVETPQIVLDADGRCPLPRVLDAAGGRLLAAHFGTYDYTAACNITAAHQRMHHPSCEFARHLMQVTLAGTGVWLSDGATTVLPVPPHRISDAGALAPEQAAENERVVHRAWRMHYEDVRGSLERGFYQGWDLHPAQLVTRYAALFSFFLEGLQAAGERLRNFVERSAQATLVGEVFDDAATGQGLLNYFLRAINSGAVTEQEALARTGLTVEELRSRSFVRILSGRRG